MGEEPGNAPHPALREPLWLVHVDGKPPGGPPPPATCQPPRPPGRDPQPTPTRNLSGPHGCGDPKGPLRLCPQHIPVTSEGRGPPLHSCGPRAEREPWTLGLEDRGHPRCGPPGVPCSGPSWGGPSSPQGGTQTRPQSCHWWTRDGALCAHVCTRAHTHTHTHTHSICTRHMHAHNIHTRVQHTCIQHAQPHSPHTSQIPETVLHTGRGMNGICLSDDHTEGQTFGREGD